MSASIIPFRPRQSAPDDAKSYLAVSHVTKEAHFFTKDELIAFLGGVNPREWSIL